LACLCAASTVIVFALCGLWGFLPLGGALAFAGLMYVCKRAQEREENKLNPPAPAGDFITGKVNPDGDKDQKQ